jgi:hypothetical protein
MDANPSRVTRLLCWRRSPDYGAVFEGRESMGPIVRAQSGVMSAVQETIDRRAAAVPGSSIGRFHKADNAVGPVT